MGVTIYDIAKEAGVGIGTVSRVLNDHPSVSEKTRQHVQAITRRLEYRPNASAQRLARRKSRMIVLVMPRISDEFSAELLSGVQEMLLEADHDLLLFGIDRPDETETVLQRTLRDGQSDGILIASTDLPPGCTEQFLNSDVPVVLLDRRSTYFDSFEIGKDLGARMAAEYLLQSGHQRISMITDNHGSTPDERSPAQQQSQGYSAAFENWPSAVNTGIYTVDHNDTGAHPEQNPGYETASMILGRSSERRPTALVAASDVLAIGAMEAMKETGLSVPGDISVISCCDTRLSQHFGLSAIRQPAREMANKAVDRLFERMDNPSLEPSLTLFQPELMKRNTTAAFQRD